MPGPFTVKVHILEGTDENDEIGEVNLAEYVLDEHTINLRRSRSSKQRREDLAHELSHMLVEWLDYYTHKAKVKK